MPDNHQNFSLDIEAAGTTPGSVVFSIGIANDKTEEELYVVLPFTIQMQNHLTSDKRTMIWHEKDNPEWPALQAQLEEKNDTGLAGLGEALELVIQYFNDEAREAYPRRVWMKSPSFDGVMLRELFTTVGYELPWEFREERDVRTIMALAKEFAALYDFPDYSENAHDALADAKHQLAVVKYCREQLGL